MIFVLTSVMMLFMNVFGVFLFLNTVFYSSTLADDFPGVPAWLLLKVHHQSKKQLKDKVMDIGDIVNIHSRILNSTYINKDVLRRGYTCQNCEICMSLHRVA